MKIILYILTILALISSSCSQAGQNQGEVIIDDRILTGAEQTSVYLPLLKGKKVAIVANQTSVIGYNHLVDSLLNLGVGIVKVFGPEHGFRGNAGAGEKVNTTTDEKTGLPIVSLYGKHKKPTPEDLKGIDIVVFDIQDVGVRFYTYISTMSYVMEACAENDVEMIVLDRPNPNGFYVDGPMLEPEFSSFVGLHPIPVVHGMTMGEYAQMVNGEEWLKDSVKCKMKVIPLKNYTHKSLYELPVKPSPNLPNMDAIYLYPSLCFFEGTIISVGRGTEMPFQIIGHPDYRDGKTVFIPKPIIGAAPHPKYEGKVCYGVVLKDSVENPILQEKQLHLSWLINTYTYFRGKDDFFNNFFDKLAGSDKLRKQILEGKTEEEIRQSWKAGLEGFKKIRKKYLLYEDFEQ
ncbi:MAG: DUF1343 domain-containing protein [Bacteroidetes bacterium]|nr:MAG: DUF1343 domain-containing protein [Bacteroidota bacterium]